MQARLAPLKDLVFDDERVFIIPVYQRSYCWGYDNCQQLMLDILRISKETKTHFLGSVCYQILERDKYVLIDGQQRITSTMLLCKALYDYCDDPYLQNKISKLFLNDINGQRTPKILPCENDAKVFNKLMTTDAVKMSQFTPEEQDSSIYRSFSYFEALVYSALKNKFTITDIKNGIERLKIAEFNIEENENPQLIFESLNSTGVKLMNSDLIKNYVLMPIEYREQEILYKKYWIEIERLVTPEKLENFFISYWILKKNGDESMPNGRRGVISSNNLYIYFKETINSFAKLTKESIENLLSDMYKYAEMYNLIVFGSDDKSPYKETLYSIFSIIKDKSSFLPIILMYFFNLKKEGKISETQLDKLIRISETFIIRNHVCSSYGFNKAVSAKILSQLISSTDYLKIEDSYWRILARGKVGAYLPQDSKFKACLLDAEIYKKSSLCKYLLWRIEKSRNPKEIIPFHDENLTIEHICPQTLSTEWKDYLNSKTELANTKKELNRLGNLTLTGYNSELSNKTFEEKIVEYKDSNYAITRMIASKYSIWTSKEIKDRGLELVGYLTSIFSIPDKFNKEDEINNENIYSLDTINDHDSFKRTKLKAVYIDGKNRPEVESWSAFLVDVIKYFKDFNEDLFFELYNENSEFRNFMSNGPAAECNKISESIYIKKKMSVGDILRCMDSIFRFYNSKTDDNFVGKITWQVQNE